MMKTIFVINPRAGQGKKVNNLIAKIEKMEDPDSSIYITKSVGDATSYVKNYLTTNGPARFIACGGDGTLNEVLNGAMGFEKAEVGVIPVGTGNDFCRNFGDNTDFFDVSGQVYTESVPCDAIRYQTVVNGKTVSGYCANMFNIGFDCNVADLKGEMEKKPCVSGSMSYLISIFATLIRKKGANVKIEMDGNVKHEGKLLLISIANGSYCGGGIRSNPLASVSDGRININIIKNISRCRFLYLLPFYMKGTHMGLKNIDEIIVSEKCSKIKISPLDEKFRLCVDGEIIDAGETEFEICPGSFRFVLPEAQGLIKPMELTEQNSFSRGV